MIEHIGRAAARGLKVALLAVPLLHGAPAYADNTTVGNAIQVPAGGGLRNCVTANNDTKYFQTSVVTNRSYVIEGYPQAFEASRTDYIATATVEVSRDSAFTDLVTIAANFTPVEGSQNSQGGFSPGTAARFTATTSGDYFFRWTMTGGAGRCYFVTVRETTLFSPWTSRAAGFEGFIELHNNTNAPIAATIRAYNSLGVLHGTGLNVTIPANATIFKTAGEVGVPVEFAGVTLTHNGAFGAISGNITTLNGANGLSFDSPFTARTDTVRIHN